MILGIQLLGIFFGIVMMYITYYYYKRNNYSWKSLALWFAVWIGFVTIILIPQAVYGLMALLEIQRTQDFLVTMGLLFYGVLLFYLYALVKRNSKKVEQLVRTLAIEQAEKKEKKKTEKKKTNR